MIGQLTNEGSFIPQETVIGRVGNYFKEHNKKEYIMSKVKITVSSNPFMSLLKITREQIRNDQLFEKIFQLFFNFSDFFVKITTVHVDDSPTFASELFVSLEPSDSFLSLCTAITTRYFDSLILQHKRFLMLYTQNDKN